jgi:hypothetical protein
VAREGYKNEGLMQGITIVKNDEPTFMAPTLYPAQYESLESLLKNIRKALNDADEMKDVDFDEIRKPEYILKNVIPEVVSEKSPLVERYVNRKFLDLALIYRVPVTTEADECRTFLVSEELIAAIGLTELDLFEAVRARNDYTLKSMKEVLEGMLGSEIESFMPEDNGMFVVSRANNVFGAGVLVTDYLVKVAERLGDFVVIPSSIHELIVIPDEIAGYNYSGIHELVCSVNATEVQPGDKLVDGVYRFSVANGLEKVA